MDSLTHIVLGAIVGETLGRGQPVKRALVLGAVAQSLPDIDFLAFLWTSPAEDLLAHRGFTHSILFIVLLTPLLSLAAKRWYPDPDIPLRKWFLFFGLQLVIHDFLDAFNAYGTGWFEPFSHSRISFNTLFVADPFFSILPALICAALFMMPSTNLRRKTLLWVAIAWSIAYLVYAISNKVSVEKDIKAALTLQSIRYDRLLTTPTPLNTWLWWVVAEDQRGYHVGFRSRFDQSVSMDLHYFPKNDSLLNPVHDLEEVQYLKRFSQGYYTAEMRGNTLVFNDLRFGQNGWDNPEAKFVFNFYLNHPDANSMVVQRGRFAHWNRETVASFISRIKGN